MMFIHIVELIQGAQRLSASRTSSQPVALGELEGKSSAQRLSASRTSSLYSRSGRVRDRQVLNAFRHHGLLHGHVKTFLASASRAQRLSASRTSSHRPTRPRLAATAGAQRLSASRTSSRLVSQLLNAITLTSPPFMASREVKRSRPMPCIPPAIFMTQPQHIRRIAAESRISLIVKEL